ncbi:MAG TPA: 2-dehydropantoate 2-reductase [Tepidisphaeraceae bacterium]|nr:2-dehydropantoate 2-reductase [Tepidisphaeraceae bacterium]
MFQRIAIIGSGALGSYYGARLAQHGRDVHFLMRSDYAFVREHGLRVYSHDGDFELPASQMHVYDDPAAMPQVDLVIVTLKTTANESFSKLISPLLHEGTAILTLQNGLGNDRALADLFGAQRVLAGLAFICTNRTEPGVIRHTDHGFIKLGEYTDGLTDRATAIAQMLQQAKVPATALADIRYGQWEKLVWNVPFNGLGAALDLETDRLLASDAGRAMVRGLMHEVMAAAASVGVHLPPETAQLQIDRTATMGAYVSSMQVDRRARRPLERQSIVGNVLAVAEAGGVAAPLLRGLDELLKVVDGG